MPIYLVRIYTLKLGHYRKARQSEARIMRVEYAIIYSILSIILTVCTVSAMRMRQTKAMGGTVAFFVCSLLFPVLGNLIIISTSNKYVAEVGYYIYFLGMDVMIFSLLRLTFHYCRITWYNKPLKYAVYLLFCFDQNGNVRYRYVFNLILDRNSCGMERYSVPFNRFECNVIVT